MATNIPTAKAIAEWYLGRSVPDEQFAQSVAATWKPRNPKAHPTMRDAMAALDDAALLIFGDVSPTMSQNDHRAEQLASMESAVARTLEPINAAHALPPASSGDEA